jgi:hypothetical protein
MLIRVSYYKNILSLSYGFHSFLCIRKLVFKYGHYVLPEDGTLVLEHVGDANVMLVLIKTMYLVGTVNSVCW